VTLSEAAADPEALRRRVQQVQPRYLQQVQPRYLQQVQPRYLQHSDQSGRASPQQRVGSAGREPAVEAAGGSAEALPRKRGKSAASPLRAARS
jgi:hypothetical protein